MPTNNSQKGSNYGALNLYQLIGAPLKALIDAEAQSAMATARYIEKVGFEPSTEVKGPPGGPFEDPLGDLRTVKFNVRRPDAAGRPTEDIVELPLLSLLPIPALQIKDAELEYTVKILETRLRDAPREQIGRRVRQSVTNRSGAKERAAEDEEESALLETAEQEVELTAVYGRSDEVSSRRHSLDMQIRMKVNVEQADLPSGLARLLNMMDATGGLMRPEAPEIVDDTPVEDRIENQEEDLNEVLNEDQENG
ncbi:MAG: DUF2589 domain-containing protein [Pseudomonadota bacterium]